MAKLSTRRVLLSQVPPTPWKNGGGVTREIATGASLRPGRAWGWRFSIAEVARDGPFSLFPETDRIVAVIDGAGMDLLGPDGGVTALEPFRAVRIAGEAVLSGRLRGGPVRDLNVMTARGQFTATLAFWRGPRRAAPEVGRDDCFLLHNLAGGCAVQSGDGESCQLAPEETLVHEGAGAFTIGLAEDAQAAVVRIVRREGAGPSETA